jgi:hypothetical protein
MVDREVDRPKEAKMLPLFWRGQVILIPEIK